MAEPDFEAQLTRLYNEAPSFPDAELFAAQVGASSIAAGRCGAC
jgi:hypothetical protein